MANDPTRAQLALAATPKQRALRAIVLALIELQSSAAPGVAAKTSSTPQRVPAPTGP